MRGRSCSPEVRARREWDQNAVHRGRPRAVWNANGTLDTAFGTKGKETFNPLSAKVPVDHVNALAFDPSGTHILLAGGYPYSFVLRLNASNGSLDTTFGSGGMVTGPNTAVQDEWKGMQVESDGSIDLVGTNGGQPVIEHLDASGKNATSVTQVLPTISPYSPFHGGGVFNGQGKIVSAQTAFTSGHNPEDVIVFQNNATGPLDTSFGGNVYTSLGGTNYQVTSGTDGVTRSACRRISRRMRAHRPPRN